MKMVMKCFSGYVTKLCGNSSVYCFFTVQLRLTTAPTYYHFPPTGKRKPEDRFDVGRSVVTMNRKSYVFNYT